VAQMLLVVMLCAAHENPDRLSDLEGYPLRQYPGRLRGPGFNAG
jgi:hypothetical protein